MERLSLRARNPRFGGEIINACIGVTQGWVVRLSLRGHNPGLSGEVVIVCISWTLPRVG